MSSKNIIRWSGIACVLSGVLLPVSWYMEIVFGNEPSILSMSLDFVAITLLVFGLIGIYGCQVKESGVYGILGFLLTVLMSCIALSMISWSPETTEAPEVAETLTLLMGIVGLIGYILLGIGSWRANTLPRWSAVFWPLGTLISAVGGMADNLEILHVIGISIWALGILGAGVKLWSTKGEPARIRETITQAESSLS
jgi:hypothetical protein